MRTAVALACWAAVVVNAFFGMWLVTHLWVLSALVTGGLWLLAVVASLVVVVHHRRRRVLATGLAVGALVLGAAVLVVDWPVVYARVWFAVHAADFAAAADLARSGGLGPVGGWEYYGPELPAELRVLSVDGRISSIGAAGGGPVLFVPALEATPDGAAGFAHLLGPAGDLDGYGDPVTPRFPLGDGWWWVA